MNFHIGCIKEFMAFLTVITMYAAMQFKNIPAAGCLMQAINILGNDSLQPAFPFPLSQFLVGGIRFGVEAEHLIMIETIEFVRMRFKKRMT